MREFFLKTIAVFTACFLVVTAFAQEARPNSVTGIVRDHNGKPLANAGVVAYYETAKTWEGKTNAGGVFSFPVTKDGKYRFEFSADGFFTQQKGPYEVKAANGLSVLVDLVPEQGIAAEAEDAVIKGVVLSLRDNAPISGASVTINGRMEEGGTLTAPDGSYTLKVPKGTTKIVFTHINFQVLEIPYRHDNLNDFRVVSMPELDKSMEEVTVVAFGTQKKESVVSSIATINPADLRQPTSNLTTSLAGQVAGIIAYQRSGEPGRDNAEFFIRGITSFGTSGLRSPLILIDNVEMTSRDLAILQPDDIASFSVMKDASAAALYGARGANGVILVTTKKGVEGRPQISFRVETSRSAPTRMIETTDPIRFMELHNEAVKTRDPLEPLPYSQGQIDNLKFGTNPYVYPSVNWSDMMIKPYTFNHRYNFNLSGGGKVARYYLAATYNRDNGILNVDKLNNFNNNVQANAMQIRSNIDINVTKSTQVGIKMYGTFDEYTGPLNGGAAVFSQTRQANPVMFPAIYPADSMHQYSRHTLFGNVPSGNYLNPYAELVKGYQNSSKTNLLTQLEVYQDLNSVLDGLKVRALVNTQRASSFALSRQFVPYYYIVDRYDRGSDTYTLRNINPTTGQEFLSFSPGAKDISTSFYLESAVNYDNTFNSVHSVGGMLVYYMRSSLNANQDDLLRSLPYRNLGVSGRFTYNYDRRYFLEWNFGYNGSERFDIRNRFGFFPSIGLGWIISNEEFFRNVDFVKTLKLRGTYGVNGNDAIGDAADRFFYLSNVNLLGGGGPGFGLDYNFPVGRNTAIITRYANPHITWERARKLNAGFELSLTNGLNLVADYFRENRDNILMTRSSITPEMGLEAPVRANVGKAYSQGFEASLDYSHRFNSNFTLSSRGNFTYAVGRYKKYEEPEYTDAPWLSMVGQPITQQWGYVAERLFVDQEDINNSPVQQFGGEYMAGDIKYADINGDGLIDFRDRVPIGFPVSPEIIYGFGFSSNYKAFDASIFFQGSARSSFWIDRNATAPFVNQSGGMVGTNALLKVYEESHWSEANQDIYALWPRLSANTIPNNNQTSTWFMRNGTFLRLKQAEIGYTFPREKMNRFFISNCRIYANGLNLLTLSKFDLWDPEMAGNGLGYPVQRVFNLGIQLSFR